MLDADMVNEINNESYAEYMDTQSMKNKILGMSNTKRKQEEWSKLFTPQTQPDDSYILNGIIY